ncbi:hypothetical protein [Nonomuraea sp. KM90]|uniref:hypothetical protein n=1 Tax=Nonomuraea sp. KM90 TaxID=3457428 RepID=UPI003FCD5807
MSVEGDLAVGEVIDETADQGDRHAAPGTRWAARWAVGAAARAVRAARGTARRGAQRGAAHSEARRGARGRVGACRLEAALADTSFAQGSGGPLGSR